MDKIDILKAASLGLAWMKRQEPISVKDLSRSIQALSFWDETNSDLIEVLLSKKMDACWKTGTPLLDSARACIALARCGILQSETIQWILAQQKTDSWNLSEIDTAYALIALGDAGIRNDPGCEWLSHNYGKQREHVGTTSLILTAFIKQDQNRYRDFIQDRAGWLISKRESGGWLHTATSNLAIQALLLSDAADVEQMAPSIQWLLEKQDEGNWGSITSTALSLISLKMYLDNPTVSISLSCGEKTNACC